MAYTKPGSPFLFDETTNDIVGFKDRDASEVLLSPVSGGGIVPPAGFNFDFSTFPGTISKIGRTAITSYSARQFMPAACWASDATFYMVDPTAGSDTNTGIDSYDGRFRGTTSLATIGKAISLGNATNKPYRVILKGGITYAMKDILLAGAIVYPARSICVIGSGSLPAIVSTHADPVTAWTNDGTGNNTYVATGGMLGTTPTFDVGRVMDTANRDLFGDFKDLDAVGSLATCRATANSYFIDASTSPNSLWVHRADNSAVTTENTRCFVRCPAMGFDAAFTAGSTYFSENVEYHGGGSNSGVVGAFSAAAFGGATGTIVAHNRCAYRYGTMTTGNGLATEGVRMTFLSNWVATGNGADGVNIHDSNGRVSYAISVNGRGYNNGGPGSASANGYTTHDGVISIEIGDWHADNFGGNSAHVSNSAQPTRRTKNWSIGCTYGISRGNIPGGSANNASYWVSSGDGWLDCCTTETRTAGINCDNAQLPAQLGVVLVRDSYINGPVTTSGGTVGTY